MGGLSPTRFPWLARPVAPEFTLEGSSASTFGALPALADPFFTVQEAGGDTKRYLADGAKKKLARNRRHPADPDQQPHLLFERSSRAVNLPLQVLLLLLQLGENPKTHPDAHQTGRGELQSCNHLLPHRGIVHHVHAEFAVGDAILHQHALYLRLQLSALVVQKLPVRE